jgi:hypothetical protein
LDDLEFRIGKGESVFVVRLNGQIKECFLLGRASRRVGVDFPGRGMALGGVVGFWIGWTGACGFAVCFGSCRSDGVTEAISRAKVPSGLELDMVFLLCDYSLLWFAACFLAGRFAGLGQMDFLGHGLDQRAINRLQDG